VKVATFNINNINKRLDNLLAWLAKAEPDVVSLQELRARSDTTLPGLFKRDNVFCRVSTIL
jgi:exodeoxyribonuclease III